MVYSAVSIWEKETRWLCWPEDEIGEKFQTKYLARCKNGTKCRMHVKGFPLITIYSRKMFWFSKTKDRRQVFFYNEPHQLLN